MLGFRQGTDGAGNPRSQSTNQREAAMGLFKELNHVSITVTERRQGAGVLHGPARARGDPAPGLRLPASGTTSAHGLSLHIILNDQLVRPAVEREKILARYAHFALWTEDADRTAGECTGSATSLRGLLTRRPSRAIGPIIRASIFDQSYPDIGHNRPHGV